MMRAVMRREFGAVLRERTILVAIVVQLFVAGFSTFLMVGLSALYDPDAISSFPPATLATSGPERSPLQHALSRAPNLRLVETTPENATALFLAGSVDGFAGTEQRPDGAWQVTLLLPEEGLRSTLLLTQLRSLLVQEEAALRHAGQGSLEHPVLDVPPAPRGALPFGFAYATLLPILILTPVFLSGATAADLMTQELQTGTFQVLRSAPASLRRILWAKAAVPILLAPAQAALWLLLLRANGVVVAQPAVPLLVAAAGALLLSAVGVATAAIARRPGHAQALYAACVLAAMGLTLATPRTLVNVLARAGAGSLDLASYASLTILVGSCALAAPALLAFAARRHGHRT